jgi:hypothetical protein
MKKLSTLFAIIVTTLATQAEGSTIAGIDGLTLLSASDSVSGTSNFLNYASASSADTITQATLHSNLTDSELGTYVLSIESVAYIDVELTSTSLFNGAGNDLAFFFAGKVDSNDNSVIDFSLSINGVTNRYGTEVTPELVNITDQWGTARLTAALIDLDDFGLGYASTTALEDFRILLGSDDALSRPALTMAGGFHTSASPVVVPLPLPIILFASGLGMLGLFARKKA